MITAIVPARSGSKRLPNKNIKDLNGKPLIFHTIDAVLNQPFISKVVFSTDSDQYIELVKSEYDNQVFIEKRPEAYASDTTKVHDEVVRLCETGVISTSWFMLCLPTTPLRTHATVSNFLRDWSTDRTPRFTATTYDFPIQFGFEIDSNGAWRPLLEDSPMITGNTRSQDIPKRYRPNGAIYLNTVESLRKNKTFYVGAKPFVMSDVDSIDVDTELDFVIVSSILKQKRIKNEK